jgi:hypothetical protein
MCSLTITNVFPGHYICVQAFEETGLLVRHLALDRASLFDSSWLIELRIQAKVSLSVPPPQVCFSPFPLVCVSLPVCVIVVSGAGVMVVSVEGRRRTESEEGTKG